MTDAFLLDILRSVCQPVEIAESVARAAPVLAERFPLETVLVRRVDAHAVASRPRRRSVWPKHHPPMRRGRIAGRASWMRFCRGVSMAARYTERTKGGGRRAENRRRGLTIFLPPPSVLRPPVLSPRTVWRFPPGATADAAWVVRSLDLAHWCGRAFHGRSCSVLANSLLEPFAIALENDRRVREMRTWREAGRGGQPIAAIASGPARHQRIDRRRHGGTAAGHAAGGAGGRVRRARADLRRDRFGQGGRGPGDP